MTTSDDQDVPRAATSSPLLQHKEFDAPSVFQPENLLREARRQLDRAEVDVPRVCLLDPDGDIVRYLQATGQGVRHPGWACYHTEMWVTDLHELSVGVVGLAVGAPFAVLVAEQLSASGAEAILSITSAGQIRPLGNPPYFVLITKARRDEGTSHHYLPPSEWSHLDPELEEGLRPALHDLSEPVLTGTSWTTDAPYRETQQAVDAAEAAQVDCVEMEAAALYAYGAARQRAVVCFAHITNSMAVDGDDFEKGAANGAVDALEIAEVAARTLLRY